MSDEGDKQTKKVEEKRGPMTGKVLLEDDPNAEQKDRWREIERTREVYRESIDLTEAPVGRGF